MTDRPPEASSSAPEHSSFEIRCDFCGEPAKSVRRVALDREYERLRTPHRELYACERCSAAKEKERLGAPS